ncbi:MAG: hypothetical protein QOH05_2941 [Acetobacteraceae bacterium]|jgi:hypothetical protein|nr:hypothetical protein [Acetobacteraceae bacterium]
MDETMSPARSLTTAGLLIALGAMATISPGSVSAQDQIVQANPMEVTTDTPEYCLHLLDRVSEMVRLAPDQVPREVTDLTTEGHRMCAHGQTRGGIMRLRSALMIMEKGDGAAYR